MVNVLQNLLKYLPISIYHQRDKEIWQTAHDQTNLLKHCGGMGPWVQATGFGISLEMPDGEPYKVDQLIVFARHGERYPTAPVGKGLKNVYNKLKKTKVDKYEGPLSFVQDWEYFIYDDSLLEMETNTSRFSGINDMFNFGQSIRTKYSHLYTNETILPFFTAGEQRVVDSADSFAKGFFLGDTESYENYTSLQILPEKKKQGANTLTTGKSCAPYNKYQDWDKHDLDSETEGIFKFHHILRKEAKRLNELSPGFDITAKDVLQLLMYCPFELNENGYSEVCNALSMEAFIGLEYSRDVELYYTKAEHPFSFILGSVYINATLTLLEQGPEKLNDQALWFSFTHDTDLLYFLNALTVLDHQTKDLSTKNIEFGRFFRTSELIPMGSRILIERLSDETSDDKYIRVIVNDAVIPLLNCQDGPGYSCKLSKLRKLFDKRLNDRDFVKECEVKAKRPQYLSFYWDWNKEINV